MTLPPLLQSRIDEVTDRGQLRSLQEPAGIDFSSNDYLGFARDPQLAASVKHALDGIPMGSSGSRLIRGHSRLFEETEEALASFSRRESALLYPSGYQANLGLLQAILRPGDLVYSDELNHASLIDGIRLSGARKRIFPHRDLRSLRALLEEDRKSEAFKLIVTESLFSMEGDFSELGALAELAEEFSAYLVVDEAHATGLWDSGLVANAQLSPRVLATTHTGGKALGTSGAWIACDKKLKEYLINFSRPFIFSTAPLPILAVSLQSSLQHLSKVGKERTGALFERIRLFKKSLHPDQPDPERESPIAPLWMGSAFHAVQVAKKLQESGFDIRAIRPPTVPEGTSRLRITIKWENSVEEITRLTRALSEAQT